MVKFPVTLVMCITIYYPPTGNHIQENKKAMQTMMPSDPKGQGRDPDIFGV